MVPKSFKMKHHSIQLILFSVLMSFLLLNDLCIIQLDAKLRDHNHYNNKIQSNEASYSNVDYSLKNHLLKTDSNSVVDPVNNHFHAFTDHHLQQHKMLHLDVPTTTTGIPQLSTQQLQRIANIIQVEPSWLQHVLRILERQHILKAGMKPEILMNTILKEITSQSGASQGSINSVVDSTDDDNNVLTQRKAYYIDEPTADLQLESYDLPVATVNDVAIGEIIAIMVGCFIGLAFIAYLVYLCDKDARKSERNRRKRRNDFWKCTSHRAPHEVSIEQLEHYPSPETYQIQSGRNTPTSNILFSFMASPSQQQQTLSPQPREPPIRLSGSDSQRYLLSSSSSQSETSQLGATAAQQAQCHLTIDIPADKVENDVRSLVTQGEQGSGRSFDPEEKHKMVVTAMKVIKEFE